MVDEDMKTEQDENVPQAKWAVDDVKRGVRAFRIQGGKRVNAMLVQAVDDSGNESDQWYMVSQRTGAVRAGVLTREQMAAFLTALGFTKF